MQWEPQSVEGPDGSPRFPVGGPEDGTIAAAGSPSWSELNAQTPSRWYKRDFAAGYQTFEWTFTANHVSRDWRYFITQPGWDPSQPLSREAFDLDPFCEDEGTRLRALLDQTRTERAESLAGDPACSLSEVGYHCGFSEQASFSRAFKRWTGKSPSDYRKALLAPDH